jgi:arginine/lysine/ornithine decarboxylase
MLSKPNLFMHEAHLVGIETIRSFHMPGHSKNNDITPVFVRSVKKHGVLKMDGTTDDFFGKLGNYFPASGSVRLSQEEAALLYGTKACFFMV